MYNTAENAICSALVVILMYIPFFCFLPLSYDSGKKQSVSCDSQSKEQVFP